MTKQFPEIKKTFGFGFMRLPRIGEDVDHAATCRMVDRFMAAGFHYFDTAHPYYRGKSEEAIRECVAKRYPRDTFLLANKLSANYFETGADIPALFQLQLELCGVAYFDFYLMHAMNAQRHEKFLTTGAYEEARKLKAAGKIRHMGFSFHDSPEVLEQMLTDCPDMEFVQLQFNYVDYEDLHVASRRCYEVCRRHGKPVFVMEPVKGGSLVELPQSALKLLPDGIPASYAIRFAASFPGVEMVLSGMSDEAQVEDNIGFMQDFKPLDEAEMAAIAQVRTLYQAQHRIPCTGCSYCTDGCPAGIPIPQVFAQMNSSRGEEGVAPDPKTVGTAAQCLACGQCESVCPQQLHIIKLLAEITGQL